MPVAWVARWDICAFRRGLGFRWVWAVCSGGIFSPLSLSWCYTELGQGGLQFTAIAITPLSLSWCYTELGQGRAVGLGDDHRRGGRFIALRVLGFGFRARVKGLGSSV